MTRHVVAMGGGGFLRSLTTTTPLDGYVLSLVDRKTPHVCFVPTAGGDNGDRIAHFYEVWDHAKFGLSHISFFRRDTAPFDDLLSDVDVLYVAGGNTANLLAIWKLHGFDEALDRRADARDIVVCGPSAGGLCWYDCGVTDSFTPELGPLDDGMGWVTGSFCPHYDEEPRRQPVYRGLIESGRLPAGIAVDGGAAAHYADGDLVGIVAERPGSTAHTLERGDGGVVEKTLEARAL